MLLSKKVIVKWNGKNRKHYEFLGYIFTRHNNEFEVQIDHLLKGSHVEVDVKCDYCGKIKPVKFYDYHKHVEKCIVQKYACENCKHKKQQEISLLKYGKVHKNVLEESVVKEEVEKRGYVFLSIEKDKKTNKYNIINYICPKHGIQSSYYTNFKKGHECKYCGYEVTSDKLRTWTIELVREEFQKRGYKLLEDVYISTEISMRYRCLKHIDKIQTIRFGNLQSGRGCKYCANEKKGELFRHNYSFVKTQFENLNYILLEDKYKNYRTPMKFICEKHPEEIQETTFMVIQRGAGCYHCGLDKLSGENNWNWKGGTSNLHEYLRAKISPWKIDSFKLHKNKCVLTGIKSKTLVVHHFYGFNQIVDETMDILNLPIFNMINKYTEEELKLISEKCLELHYNYGLGFPLLPIIHDLFHQLYGRGNNTPEQFEEFTQRYYNGEFEDILNQSA